MFFCSGGTAVSLRTNHHHFLLLGFLLFSINFCTARSSEEDKPAPAPPRVTVGTVVRKNVPISREWLGIMIGNADAEIRPKVEGFLLKRPYTEGS